MPSVPLPETAIIHVNGWNFNVLDVGRGAPIVLLHGFPDSLKLWRHLVQPLVDSGFRVIAYDQRGFGASDAPSREADYAIDLIVSDLVSILRQLKIEEPICLVGHDWGAFVGWQMCLQHPELVKKFAAVSVGHPLAFRNAGLQQKLKSWYVIFFQWRGFAEHQLSKDNFAAFRRMTKGYPELETWIADIARPGRLTAALNWYRANFELFLGSKFGRCKVPTLGIHSPSDVALTVKQMVDSSKYMDAEWRYFSVDNSTHWIPLDRPEQLLSALLDWFAEINSSLT